MIVLTTASAVSAASPQRFFARWIDHTTWGEWSPDTRWARVVGPVETGARGVLKPRGGPAVRFVVTACRPGREYTDTSRFPGARLVFRHTAEPDGAGSRLAVEVAVGGPLARVWALLLGSGFRRSAQADLDRLVAVVERTAVPA